MTIPLSDKQFGKDTALIHDAIDNGLLPALGRIQDDARWRRAELAKAQAEIERLRDALEELMVWQNGPPLVTYEEGWTAAMAKANAVLASTAPKSDACLPEERS